MLVAQCFELVEYLGAPAVQDRLGVRSSRFEQHQRPDRTRADLNVSLCFSESLRGGFHRARAAVEYGSLSASGRRAVGQGVFFSACKTVIGSCPSGAAEERSDTGAADGGRAVTRQDACARAWSSIHRRTSVSR